MLSNKFRLRGIPASLNRKLICRIKTNTGFYVIVLFTVYTSPNLIDNSKMCYPMWSYGEQLNRAVYHNAWAHNSGTVLGGGNLLQIIAWKRLHTHKHTHTHTHTNTNTFTGSTANYSISKFRTEVTMRAIRSTGCIRAGFIHTSQTNKEMQTFIHYP